MLESGLLLTYAYQIIQNFKICTILLASIGFKFSLFGGHLHRKSRSADLVDQNMTFCEKFTNPTPTENGQFEFFNPINIQNTTDVYPAKLDCYLIIKGKRVLFNTNNSLQ